MNRIAILIAVAGLQRAALGDIGVELETRVPILLKPAPSGSVRGLEGRFDAASKIALIDGRISADGNNRVMTVHRSQDGSQEIFHLDVDHTTVTVPNHSDVEKMRYSNLEFVSAPFNEHAFTDAKEALGKWRNGYGIPMMRLWADLHQQNDVTVADLASDKRVVAAEYRGAVASPASLRCKAFEFDSALWKVDLKLYAHFTIGVPLARVPVLFEQVLTNAEVTSSTAASKRTAFGRAQEAASLNVAALGIPSEDGPAVKGYVQLLYVHAAALADSQVGNDKGERYQIKNRVMALSRAGFGEIFTMCLSPSAKQWIVAHSAQIDALLNGTYAATSVDGSKVNLNSVGAPGNELDQYMTSALKGQGTGKTQRETFGTTTVSPHPVRDGKGEVHPKVVLIPLELRNLKPPGSDEHRMSWRQLEEMLQALMRFTRDGVAPFPPRGVVAETK